MVAIFSPECQDFLSFFICECSMNLDLQICANSQKVLFLGVDFAPLHNPNLLQFPDPKNIDEGD